MSTVFHTSAVQPQLMKTHKYQHQHQHQSQSQSQYSAYDMNKQCVDPTSICSGTSPNNTNTSTNANTNANANDNADRPIIYKGISHVFMGTTNPNPNINSDSDIGTLRGVSLLNGNPTTMQSQSRAQSSQPSTEHSLTEMGHGIRLISGIHTVNNGRVVISGSMSMCSNRYMRYIHTHTQSQHENLYIYGNSSSNSSSNSNLGNMEYCIAMLKWSFHQSHLLRVSTFQHFNSDVNVNINHEIKTDGQDREDGTNSLSVPVPVPMVPMFLEDDTEVGYNSNSNSYPINANISIQVCIEEYNSNNSYSYRYKNAIAEEMGGDIGGMGCMGGWVDYTSLELETLQIDLICLNVKIRKNLTLTTVCRNNNDNNQYTGQYNNSTNRTSGSIDCHICYTTTLMLPDLPGIYKLQFNYNSNNNLYNILLIYLKV